jgi:hypothetical protein
MTFGELRSRILELVAMRPFDNMLSPVDFLLPCTAIAAYAQTKAACAS